MRKAISTKVVRAVPVEFAKVYAARGQEACERMYGKRATMRYRRAIGKLTLNRLRRAFVRGEAL